MNKIRTSLVLLSILLVSFSFLNCGGSKSSNNILVFKENPPFEIQDANFQKWAAGIEEGGTGININIHFSNLDSEVIIQNVFFRGHTLVATKLIGKPNHYVAYLKNKSENKGFVMHSDPIKEGENTFSNEFPFQLEENEAVISYWYNGERNFYKIIDLSEKQEIAYPQSYPKK